MKPDTYIDAASTVCLDATQVKRIREQLQLTQLYVSKVVGVTTDTISRWENNRYPTIRRENALKLAEALEVPLADLLQQPAEDTETSSPETGYRPIVLIGMVVSLLLLTAIVLYSFSDHAPSPVATVTAQRDLPNFAAPGSTLPVQITLDHRTNNNGFILREYFPKDWKIVQANPPASSLDNINGVARWIVKAGDNRDRIVYLIQVDSLAKENSDSLFRGEIVASKQGNQSAVPVRGDYESMIADAHWADADGNGQIDDGEMLEASFTIEDMAGVHIDWNDLEKIWDAGSYRWDEAKSRFLPKVMEP